MVWPVSKGNHFCCRSIGAVLALYWKDSPSPGLPPPPLLRRAFAGWSDSDPRWRALWDMMAHHLEAELGTMQGAAASADQVLQLHGRVQMMLFLRSQILHLRGTPDV